VPSDDPAPDAPDSPPDAPTDHNGPDDATDDDAPPPLASPSDVLRTEVQALAATLHSTLESPEE
jgi:hypothetical protein